MPTSLPTPARVEASATSYRISESVFDPESGELRAESVSDDPVVLRPQVAALLAHLCERPGEMVTRDELIRELWDERHVDGDQGLNQCVRQLRHALGDDASAPRYVETLPRRGYRLIAPVTPIPPVAPGPVAPRRGRWRLAVGLAAVAGVIVIGLAWIGRGNVGDDGPAAASPTAPTTVVPPLPSADRLGPPPEGRAREPFAAAVYHLRRFPELAPTRRAVERFREAALLAPDHAASWAGLAAAYALLPELPEVEREEARAAAERAVELAPEWADAHFHRGRVAFWIDLDWRTAEASFERALALDPEWVRSREELAFVWMLTGRFEQAAAEIRRCLEIDPLSAVIFGDAALIFLAAGEYDEALDVADRLDAFGIEVPSTAVIRLVANDQLGHLVAARDAGMAHLRELGLPASDLESLPPAEALERYRRRKLEYFLGLESPPPVGLAVLHAELGETRAAVENLEKAVDIHPKLVLFNLHDPRLRKLCVEPGFLRLLERLDLGRGSCSGDDAGAAAPA